MRLGPAATTLAHTQIENRPEPFSITRSPEAAAFAAGAGHFSLEGDEAADAVLGLHELEAAVDLVE